MRMRIKLLNQGHRNFPFWWLIAQPLHKKLNGRYVERLGLWAPRTGKTKPRRIEINTHRMRYWLSVGAIPTKGAHRVLERYGMVPKMPSTHGSFHDYEKPERHYVTYPFKGFGEARAIRHNEIAFTYRQKLQEQMNIVERKRRLTTEALESAQGNNLSAQALNDDYIDDEDTDGMESDEVDIFERKRKFEKLLDRFERHRRDNRLQLKGNDLRYNVYLKKLKKYARKDLGLDIAGYKDYVSNLRQFARVNNDFDIFAKDSLFNEEYAETPHVRGHQLFNVEDEEPFYHNKSGYEKMKENRRRFSVTISKLMRSFPAHLTIRDRENIDELKKNFKTYIAQDVILLERLRLLNKKHKKECIDREDRRRMIKDLQDVPDEVLIKADVKRKEYDQIQMLMKLDQEIFMNESNIHGKPNTMWENIYDNFVDFSRLPKKLPKPAKDLLYRPDRMKKLAEKFDRIVDEIENDWMKKQRVKEAWELDKFVKMKYQFKKLPKLEEDFELRQELIQFMDDFFAKADLDLRQEKRHLINQYSSLSPFQLEERAMELDENFKIDHDSETVFYQSALKKLLQQRRQTPKAERVAEHQDSIDEVDTTDLERWAIKTDVKIVEQISWSRLAADDEDFDEEANELGESMLDEQEKPGYKPIDQGPQMVYDPRTAETQRKRLMLEHRVSFARMYLNQGTPYTLRKFKKIFKHEMTHNPQLYGIIKKDAGDQDEADFDENVAAASTADFVQEGEVQIEGAPVEEEDIEGLEKDADGNELDAEGNKMPEDWRNIEDWTEEQADEYLMENEEQAKEMYKDMLKKDFEDAKKDLLEDGDINEKQINELIIDEEQFEEILDKMVQNEFGPDEEIDKWLEEQLQQYAAMSARPGEGKSKNIKPNFFQDPYPHEDDVLKRRQINEEGGQAMFLNEYLFTKEEEMKEKERMQNNYGKYPPGFRHYESYMNYCQVYPDRSIQDYMTDMNRQVSFSEFVAIAKASMISDAKQHRFDFYFEFQNEEQQEFEDEDAEPKGIDAMKEFVESDEFIEQARQRYTEEVHDALCERRFFTLVEVLEDTMDIWHMGTKMFDYPVHNTYVPATTLLQKPKNIVNETDELGWRYNDIADKKTTHKRVNPAGQLNPLSGFRMTVLPKKQKNLGDIKIDIPHWRRWDRMNSHQKGRPRAGKMNPFSTINKPLPVLPMYTPLCMLIDPKKLSQAPFRQ